MSRPTPTPDQPITTGTIRRLIYAAAFGCTIVSAFSLALTAGLGTPTAAGLAAVAAALMFAVVAFEIVETRAAQRAALVAPVVTHMAGGVLHVDDERAAARLATHAEFATLVVAAGIDPVLARWVDADSELTTRDVARAAVEALLDEPELLDHLAEFVIAVGSEPVAAAPEPAGVAT